MYSAPACCPAVSVCSACVSAGPPDCGIVWNRGGTLSPLSWHGTASAAGASPELGTPGCTCCNGTGNHGDQKEEGDRWVRRWAGKRGGSELGTEEPVCHWKGEWCCLPGVGWVELWHLWVRLHLPQCSPLKCLQNIRKIVTEWWNNNITTTRQCVLNKWPWNGSVI